MGTYGTYCGTELPRYLSQVEPSQLRTLNTDALYNGFLEGTLIPKAEKFIDGYCNHSFGTPNKGWINLDGSGKSVLFLPPEYCPPIGFSAGSVNGVAINTTLIHSYEQHLKYEDNVFLSGEKNVALNGSWGYATLPDDIQYVCGQLCANILLDMVRRNMAPDLFMSLTGASESGGPGISTLFAMPNVFTKGLKEILNAYRIQWIDLG